MARVVSITPQSGVFLDSLKDATQWPYSRIVERALQSLSKDEEFMRTIEIRLRAIATLRAANLVIEGEPRRKYKRKRNRRR